MSRFFKKIERYDPIAQYDPLGKKIAEATGPTTQANKSDAAKAAAAAALAGGPQVEGMQSIPDADGPEAEAARRASIAKKRRGRVSTIFTSEGEGLGG